jgi:hypothetical protein
VTAPFACALLGWKPSSKNKLGWPLVPNLADVDNPESMRIAAGMLDELGVARDRPSAVPRDPGGPLEQAVCDHLGRALPHLERDRGWIVARGEIITRFDQVYHVAYDALAASVAANANPDQQDAWREVTGQRRLLSYELLVSTLASW